MKKTITIILILIVVGFGVYFFVSNNKSVTPVDNSQTSTTTTTTTTNTSTTTTPSDVSVSIKNFSFTPNTLNIKTGTKVIWTNDDSVAHTVTSDSGSLLNSPTLSPGDSFSFTFADSGSVNYHCNIHKMMKGEITIQK